MVADGGGTAVGGQKQTETAGEAAGGRGDKKTGTAAEDGGAGWVLGVLGLKNVETGGGGSAGQQVGDDAEDML